MTQEEFEKHRAAEIAKLKTWDEERIRKSADMATKINKWAKGQGMQ